MMFKMISTTMIKRTSKNTHSREWESLESIKTITVFSFKISTVKFIWKFEMLLGKEFQLNISCGWRRFEKTTSDIRKTKEISGKLPNEDKVYENKEKEK
jgi:hypothetical protein